MKYLLMLLIPTLVTAKGSQPNGSTCTGDSDCFSYCCNNDNDYANDGLCVDIKEDEECVNRLY